MVWTSWGLDRIVILLVGVAYLLTSIQATLFHYRQNFRHPAMWLPVIGGPVMGLIGVSLVLLNARFLLALFRIFLWIVLFAGFVGFYYHLRGVHQRVGGYGMNNVLIGPPILLPLMFGSLTLFGIFAVYWR